MKKVIRRIEEYLSIKSGKSSLRLNVTTMVQTANTSFIVVILVTAYKILKGTPIDLLGVTAVLTAITAFAGSALWGKNADKNKGGKNEE